MSGANPSSLGELAIWAIVVVAAFVVIALAARLLKQRLVWGRPSAGDTGWSLQQLRELRADGRITEAEFTALKDRLLCNESTASRAAELSSPPGPQDRQGAEKQVKPRGNQRR